MSQSALYIVGNGFDIHHGIASRYSDFKGYLYAHDRALHNLVIEYLPIDEKWSDLEAALALLNVDRIIDESMDFLQSYAAEDWSDSFHHDYQYELDKIISALSKKLKNIFSEWLSQLVMPNSVNVGGLYLNINKDSIFLNFNYTPTLESIYHVLNKNILYIHGKLGADDSKIILGHAWNPEEIPDLNNVENPEDMDTRIMEGNEIVNKYFSATFKATQKIIEENKDFFERLRFVSSIFVLGHSLSEVDQPYIEKVLDCVHPDAVWKVSYYDEKELVRHRATVTNLGIKNVIFCELQNI